MTGYYNNYDAPQLTFISTPEFLETALERQFLSNPYLLLKFRPSCACGKEFRSSGKDKAQAQIQKHLSYKKYANCKPVVEELNYNIPEFVTLKQVKGSKANRLRNANLQEQIEQARLYQKWQLDPELAQKYGLEVREDGSVFNTERNETLVQPVHPKVIDGYQIDKFINIKATVSKKSKVRDVQSNKTGQEFTVCEATLQDENGDDIVVTLWNELCKQISEGDKITIRNAYVKEGQTYRQGFGYSSRIELALYKNASTITVDQKAQSQEVSTS